MRRICRAIAVIIWLAVSAIALPAQAEGEGPRRVSLGIYVNRISNIDLRQGTADFDLFVWLRSPEAEANPAETLQLVNGVITSQAVVTESVEDGKRYTCIKMEVTAHQIFDLADYPLDSHTLSLFFEDADAEADVVRFMPDTVNSTLGGEVRITGWLISKLALSESTQAYKTTFGDPTLADLEQLDYSRVRVDIPVQRSGVWLMVRLFVGLAISVMVALLALLIKPTEVDPRFGLGVGGLFTAVASQYVISSSIPEGGGVTLAEWMNLLGIVIIFLSITESVASLYLDTHDRGALAKRLDRASALALSVLFFGGCVMLLMRSGVATGA